MTDRELELRLRAWYSAEVPATETAPTALRASVMVIPRHPPRPIARIGGRRPFALMAAAALVALALAGAILFGGPTLPTVKPSPTPDRASPHPPVTQTAIPRPLLVLPIAGMVADWRQVFAASDSVAWVVTPSGAYRTDDLGATWREVTPPRFDAQFWNLTLVDTQTAYAAPADPSATIYFTHDGGLEWSPSVVNAGALGGPAVLSFTSPMAGTATFFSNAASVPNSLEVFSTSDGGTSWSPAGTGTVPHLTDSGAKVQGPTGGYMWLSAGKSDTRPFDNRFFLTADGGVTWTQYTFPIGANSPRNALKEIVDLLREPDGHFLIAINVDAPTHDVAIYESTDDPTAWRLAYQVPDIGFVPQLLSPTTWILASPGEIRTTVDAGATWTAVTPTPDPGFWHVHFATTHTGWARVGGTGDPQTLIVTTDGGAKWRRIGS